MKAAAVVTPVVRPVVPAAPGLESQFVTKLKEFGAGFMCMLREIGDENGYQRWLVEKNVPHSGENWRAYCDDRFAKKMKNPKCC